MSFFEIRFPESISFNSSFILEFNTTIIKSKNGFEQRNVNWNNAKMKYNIINGIKTKEDLNQIRTFFRNVKGCAYGFRFKDWSDYSAKDQRIGNGNGIKDEFQLIKTYNINDNIYVRKITKPVISTIKVYINNEEVSDFNINLKTGTIKFNEIPKSNDIITVDFEFDVPVRFDNDLLEITMETINTGRIKDLNLLEINSQYN